MARSKAAWVAAVGGVNSSSLRHGGPACKLGKGSLLRAVPGTAEGNEPDGGEVAGTLLAVGALGEDAQPHPAGGADRDDHLAAGLELLPERPGHVVGAAGDEDGVERG